MISAKKLSLVPVGKTVTVTSINCGGITKRKLIDMGITPGVKIYVRKTAPLGDPIQIFLRGYELSIRKSDAASINVSI